MISQKDVTIIIPHLGETKEQEYAFNECIASLRESTPEIRIVVAKNGGSCPHPRDVRVVAQGQCKAVNAAVAITNTPWIMISNDDMIYAPGWFEKLVEPLGQKYLMNAKSELSEEDLIARPHSFIPVDHNSNIKKIEEILCISPMLVEPRPGAPTFETYFCGGAGGDFNKQEWLRFASGWDLNVKRPRVVVRTGFNLPFLIRRDLWDLVGGYNINYDPWGSNSDSDLEYKIRLAGVQPYQNTNCVVYHFSQTSGTFEPRNQGYWGKNFAYFKETWGFERTDKGIWEANFPMPTIAEGRIFQPWWEGFYNK
jgi:hypothetical protein